MRTRTRTATVAPLLLLLLLALGAALAGACDGDAAATDDLVDDTTVADTSEDTAPGDDTTGADTGGDTGADTAQPPPPPQIPAWLEVEVAPARASYRLAAPLQLTARVHDLDTQPIEEAELTWRVEPEGAAFLDGGGFWRPSIEGPITFAACTVEPGYDGVDVCGSRTVWVDDHPPELEVDTPLPGDQLDAATSPTIEVRGRVTDTHGSLTLFVNGESVPLAEDGAFSHALTPHFGINAIEVTATDGIHGGETRVIFDVLWADSYLAVDPTPPTVALAFDDGLQLELGQRFFDDDQPPLESPTAIETSDLADILGLLMTSIDLLAQLPNPVVDQSGLQLSLTGVDLGAPLVDLDLTETGAEVFIQIPELVLGTDGLVDAGGQLLDLEGEIQGSVSLLATLTIARPDPQSPFVVELTDVTLALEQATSAFVSDDANAIFEVAESQLRSRIEVLLLDTVESSFVSALPGVLLDVLEGLDTALAGQSFPIDTGLGPVVTLSFDAHVARLWTRTRDALAADLSTALGTDQPSHFADARGVPLLAGFAERAPFFASSRLQIAARMALLNGLLYALWQSGLLEVDLTELVGEGSTLTARLPPVIHPPRAGEPWDLMITLGQLEVIVDLGSLGSARYGLTIRAGITVGLADNTLSLVFAETPEVHAWLIESSSDTPLFEPAALEAMVLGDVWPRLSEAFAGGINFALPIPALDGLANIAPAMAGFALELSLARPADVREDFVVFDALLTGLLRR